jgi:hypothetical protein
MVMFISPAEEVSSSELLIKMTGRPLETVFHNLFKAGSTRLNSESDLRSEQEFYQTGEREFRYMK